MENKPKRTKNGLAILNTEQVQNLLPITFCNDKDKGVIILGFPGTGKTTLMNSFLINKRVYKTTAENLGIKYNERGHKIFSPPSTEMPYYNDFYKLYYGLNGDTPIFIDDIGSEPAESYAKNPYFETVIKTIYEKGGKLYGTSNATVEQIISLYGERVWSRLEEMCHIVVLEAPNHRKIMNEKNIQEIYDLLDLSAKSKENIQEQATQRKLVQDEEKEKPRPLNDFEIMINKEFEQFLYQRQLEKEKSENLEDFKNMLNDPDFPEFLREKKIDLEGYKKWLNKMTPKQLELFEEIFGKKI
jgi:hypothetical protein